MAAPLSKPDRDDPALLRQTIADLKTSSAQLLALVEHSLRADPEKEASQSLAFGGQIRELLQKIDTRLGLLLERIAPWPERRAAFPAELAAEVDAFLALLGAGLEAMQKQLRHRVGDIEHRMAEIKKNLTRLGRQGQAVRNYKQGGTTPRRINKKA